jgi:hypothetical protein
MLRASIIVKELSEPLARDASEARFFYCRQFHRKKKAKNLRLSKKQPIFAMSKNY